MVIGMYILSNKSLLLFFVSAFGFSLFGNFNFSRQTIDLGMVVSDSEKSVTFFKQVIGFQEVDGFEVKGSFPKAVGLTDGAHLNVSVLDLDEE